MDFSLAFPIPGGRGNLLPLLLSLDFPLEPAVNVGLPEEHLPVELDSGESLLDELLEGGLGDSKVLLTLDLCHIFPCHVGIITDNSKY